MPADGGGPAVGARVRARWSKTGKLRFVSAIDVGRVWERSLRRADLPIAYSEGFSPHPKVSFPDALPLGYASIAEYVELTFAAPVDASGVARSLNAVFPDGIQVVHAVAAGQADPKLARLLQASCWDVDYPAGTALGAAVEKVAAAATLRVERQRKGEPVLVDLRPAVHLVACFGSTVRLILHHLDAPDAPAGVVAARPSELHLALRRFASDLPEPILATRVAQGRAVPHGLLQALTGELFEPLEPELQRQIT